MTGDEVVVLVGAGLTLSALIVSAVLLRPRGLDVFYVALPLLGAAVLVVVASRNAGSAA